VFPLQFEHKVLDSLPAPDDDSIKRVHNILRAIISRRIIPYFRSKRGTEPSLIARITDQLRINRFHDEKNLMRVVSLLSREDNRWDIHIHERVFDYLAFVIPSDPEARLGGESLQEGQALAFAEFLLRHEIEHTLYPQKSEREAIRSDVIFAMERRETDPTYYRMLKKFLTDEMNGVKGEPYLALLDSAEREKPYEYLITRLLTPLASILPDLPDEMLQRVFPLLDRDLKTKILGELYQNSREPSYSLLRRVAFLQKALRLFSLLVKDDHKEAEEVFASFKDRWGLIYLFRELDVPEVTLEDKEFEEIFLLFKESVDRYFQESPETVSPPSDTARAVAPGKEPLPVPTKSLKERIEEARHDPRFPPQAMEVIDKNKVAAVGHSGPKYTELIETLLAIPWGKIHVLQITPDAFEAGLNRTHFGLQRPKEITCDFFTNLIWRYQRLRPGDEENLQRTGSAFLFVGPPGVGKTSLAISIANNLGIPYHKISLGGMRDEADLRGHGFTYEGSKPGAIVQGLIKMGVMNGMFIMDEADKTEKFAVSTLLEILDPEQNHLFHDKFTMTTVDIDLSNCHFILTANTLETVPPPVLNRCEVVVLGRYGVEEKVAIGRDYLVQRVRGRYQIGIEEIFFDPEQESELLRYLIKTYTHEPGVRELERIVRTLFLRLLRKEILGKNEKSVKITRQKIKQYLDPPIPPRQISEEDRVGEMLGLGVDVERGVGSIIPIQATLIRTEGERHRHGHLSMIDATGNIEKIMDESRKVATTGILHCADQLGIDLSKAETPIHLHFMGASTRKDGPSAGGAIALALASTLSGRPVRRDVAMTGEIDTQGRILGVGSLDVKLETAYDAGCKTMIIPKENLYGEEGIERLPEALKTELLVLSYEQWKGEHVPFDYGKDALQVVAVDHIVQAAEIACIDQEELARTEASFISHARSVVQAQRTIVMDRVVHCCVIYAKALEELDLGSLDPNFWDRFKCIFLLPTKMRDEVLRAYPDLEDRARFRDFDPSRETFASAVKEVEKTLAGTATGSPLRLSIIGPFFFLKAHSIHQADFPVSPPLQELRLLASNYICQGLKVKGCKPLLHRVYCHFAQLPLTVLDGCPFLSRHEGIYCVDLSFVPEKYRLHLKRTEEILNRGLKKWAAIVEGSDRGSVYT